MSFFRRKIRRAIRSPERIGNLGERRITNELNIFVNHGINGYVFRNAYVTNAKDYTTEIDVIYITDRGIFVIESKNYSGWVFGDENRSKWTATYYVGRNFWGLNQSEKHSFYNPIWQNKTHINFLRRFLIRGIGKSVPFYSIVESYKSR